MIFSTRWLQLVPWAFGIRRVTCKTLHHFLNLQTLLENSVLRIPFSLSLVLQLEKWKEQTINQILSVNLLYWLTDYHLITNSVFENGWIYSTTVHKLTTTIWGFMSRPCWRMFSSISHSIARTWSRIYTTCNHQLQVKKKSYCHLHLTGSHLWFVSGSWLYKGGFIVIIICIASTVQRFFMMICNWQFWKRGFTWPPVSGMPRTPSCPK